MFTNVSHDTVILVVVGGLSLFFDYFPGVNTWFDALQDSRKQLITAVLAVLVGAAPFVGQCLGWFTTNLTCSVQSGWELFYGIILAVAGMYGFHKATKPAK